MNDKKLLDLKIEGPVARLVLSRAPVNAVNDALLRELNSSLQAIESNPEVIVLRITSSERTFSAGADLAMVGRRVGRLDGAAEMAETAALFHRVYARLAALPAVTIAEIGGHALGGGLELALACDLRVSANDALLGLPEAKVGLLPGAGGTQRLTQLCGPGVAARLILTGELIDGSEAARIGLVQWSHDKDDLVAAVDGVVGRIAALSPQALRSCKACIGLAQPLQVAGVDAEIQGIDRLMRGQDAAERIASFLNK